MVSRLKNTRERQQREKLLNSLGKVSLIPSVLKEEILEHMLNSCELTCVRAKPTQSSIKQSGPLLQTGLDSPSIRSRSSTKQRQSSDSCVCTNTNQKRWLSGTLEPVQHTGGEKFGTLSLPLVELEPSLRIKLQMQSFGLAKLFQTASVCDVCKGREPHTACTGEELPCSWCKAH